MSRINLSSLTGSETQSHSPELSSTPTAIKQILDLFNSLPEQDRAKFINQILSFNSSQTSTSSTKHLLKGNDDLDIDSLRFPEEVYCLHCGCTNIVKRGLSAQGKQRYFCKTCHRSFQATTKTTLEFTKKDFDTWLKYIECVAHQFSIRKSAHICSISVHTSFIWRHKVLDVLSKYQTMLKEKLMGVVEADETFFHLSFKGARNIQRVYGRKAHRRGNSIKKRGLSIEQVCVPCAVSTRGKALSQVGKLGTVNLDALAMTLGGRIEPESVLCSDRASAYIQFCKRFHLYHNNSGLRHVEKLLNAHSNTIQHINAYHSSMKSFMFPFRGVATKYLNNYLIWFNRYREERYNLKEKVTQCVFGLDVFSRRDWVYMRNPIPVVA